MPRPPIAISGDPPNRGIPLNRLLDGMALRPLVGTVAAARRISGAEVAQPCGTDKPLIIDASPMLAETAGPPSGPDADVRASAPGSAGNAAGAAAADEAAEEAPTPIAPEPQTLPMMPPSAAKPSVVATAVARSDMTVDISVAIVDDPVVPVVEASGDARACSAWGAADVNWPAEMIDCTCPADVPTAWLTATDCPARPPGLVVGCWGVNGVNVDALAEAAA